MFTLAIALFLWSVTRDTVNPSLNIDRNTDVLSLDGKPGETVDFDIHFNPLDEQYWRSSSGVSIVMDGQSQLVVAERDQKWPDTITVSSSTKQLATIPAKFVIPQNATVGQTFRGQFEGVITYPTAESGGFITKEVQIRNPVELRIVATGSYAESRRQLAVTELYVAIAAAIVMLLGLFAGTVFQSGSLTSRS
jgi:hypothetical protein